jgi:hypothetical protein
MDALLDTQTDPSPVKNLYFIRVATEISQTLQNSLEKARVQ